MAEGREASAAPLSDITEDALLGGKVRLLQPARGHRAGTDAVLLAVAAPARAGDVVVDVGAATGAVGLMIASRVPASLVFIERDPALADLCRRNLALNGMQGRAAAVDILDRAAVLDAGLLPEGADLVATNPPYLEIGGARLSPDVGRAAAHALPEGGLDRWLRACGALLRPGGTLALIHRADRLRVCLAALGKGFGAHRLRFVHPRADRPATRLLLTAVKGSRAPEAIDPPVVLHDEAGRFTRVAEALHRGEATLVEGPGRR